MTSPAAPRMLQARNRALPLGPRTLVMGILNVTPDSFSDGGRSLAVDDALATARRLTREGADILDIGGESTRPGHVPVPAEEEWARVAPVLEALQAETGVPISIDTSKAEVARRAIAAGAVIVNDVWGFTRDPEMAQVVADSEAAAVLMHNRAEVDSSLDIIDELLAFFDGALERAIQAGVRKDRIVLDPGIGFGKTFPQNLAAIARLPELRVLGYPLLLGTSRKSLIGKVIDSLPAERVPGTIASNVIGIMAGVEIIRVHDVAAHVQAARVAEAIRDAT
ncbi:dihydropteroate synthase [Roseixanthobacter glucoisosaccharinicivorans]|uniref:dihydropteroate synthase n=1 Tax=Roseixanthobacter glucoisosaccharinicivorans TaxID=3119923 RepID=UPI00372B7EC7